MKIALPAIAIVLSATVAASAGTYRYDAPQSTVPVNIPVYAPGPVYAPVAQVPVLQAPVLQGPVVVQSPLAPAPVVETYSPVIAPAPVLAPVPVVTYRPYSYYYAPAPVYVAPVVRSRTILRPWGGRTVYRYR